MPFRLPYTPPGYEMADSGETRVRETTFRTFGALVWSSGRARAHFRSRSPRTAPGRSSTHARLADGVSTVPSIKSNRRGLISRCGARYTKLTMGKLIRRASDAEILCSGVWKRSYG